MKLWGGRFTKEENQLVHNFNESLSFDQKFYEQDIRGSLAHAAMLARQGIISEADGAAMEAGLKGILEDLRSGALTFSSEYEDILSGIKSDKNARGKTISGSLKRNRINALVAAGVPRQEAVRYVNARY